VTFEDGRVATYEDETDIELNLEDFDSERDIGCYVCDARGQPLRLIVSLLELKKLEVKD
jgi:hypothetical protein